jgi:hypothetical protein
MKITAHSESHIVELDDGTKWQIFPGDLDVTLHWKPEKALISEGDDGRVRVRPVGQSWPPSVQAAIGKTRRGQRRTGSG